MILPVEIEIKYAEIEPTLALFKNNMDPILHDIAEKNSGFYISRIKKAESLLQKIEIGKFEPNKIIDLFAATIIVPNYKNIENVERDITELYEIKKREAHRKKSPETFIYDDIHVHIQYKENLITPGKEFLRRRFEIQIKTFLEYAWSKATHDILYKGDTILWQNYRIAYQIKAMLEQSDQVLMHIEKSSNICPDNDYEEFKKINEILQLCNTYWDSTSLPIDKKRLAYNILDLLQITKKDIQFLKTELEEPTNNIFLSAKSLTPQQAIIGIYIKKYPEILLNAFHDNSRKLYVSKELITTLEKIPENYNKILMKLK